MFIKIMSAFFLVTKTEFCDALDRVKEQKPTVTFPARWEHNLTTIEDEDEVPEGYELEDGEIYEAPEKKNILAAIFFLNNLVFNN